MIAENLVGFGRLLRRAGLAVTPGSTQTFAQAITVLGVGKKAEVRAAGRAIYVRRREDRELFDRAFNLFWRRHADPGDAPILPRLRQDRRPPPTFPATMPGAEALADEIVTKAEKSLTSDDERIRHADFAGLTQAEARDALAMLARLAPALPLRPSRRWRPTHRRGTRPARVRILRASLRTLGEPIRWHWLAHPRRPRPIVLITDISGSMERYSRLMLRFAHAMGQSGAPVEVFVFGTRLTRITRELRVRDADTALERVGHLVVDWNGGTRIGESLRELNRRWVRRTIRSGAVVLIMSDGWERGDPAALGAEMARLRRSCYRLYWLDPLASQPGFVPEVAGLKAALPHVDDLLPCASVASLQDLATRVIDASARRPRRFDRMSVRP
ncbi:MAG: vWA domain-containing protein [Gemmatimonadales bacterium]